jgi:hypothetical protein
MLPAASGETCPLITNGTTGPAISGESDAAIIPVAELKAVLVRERIRKGTVDVEVRVEALVASPCYQQAVVCVPHGWLRLPLEVDILELGSAITALAADNA